MACRGPEANFAKLVIDFARLHGWRVAHFRPARVRRGGVEKYETPVGADGKGWPDLVLVREELARDRILFVELKTDTGPVRPEQQEWLDRLERAGGTVFVWRPKDWPEIVQRLQRAG